MYTVVCTACKKPRTVNTFGRCLVCGTMNEAPGRNWWGLRLRWWLRKLLPPLIVAGVALSAIDQA